MITVAENCLVLLSQFGIHLSSNSIFNSDYQVSIAVNFLRHDIAATCVLKMPLNPDQPTNHCSNLDVTDCFVC